MQIDGYVAINGAPLSNMQMTVNGGVAATKYCDYTNPTNCKTVSEMAANSDLSKYLLVAESGTYYTNNPK